MVRPLKRARERPVVLLEPWKVSVAVLPEVDTVRLGNAFTGRVGLVDGQETMKGAARENTSSRV